MMRSVAVGVLLMLGGVLALAPAHAASTKKAGIAAGSDVSAQTQRRTRRPTRITVRPRVAPSYVGDFRRDCRPVFEERWIPQWGGRVLYAGQSCRWVAVPADSPPAW
jgi:hypothetical protein